MLKLYVDFGYSGVQLTHSSSLEIGELLTSGFAAGSPRGGGKNYDNYLPGLASQSRQGMHSTAVGK